MARPSPVIPLNRRVISSSYRSICHSVNIRPQTVTPPRLLTSLHPSIHPRRDPSYSFIEWASRSLIPLLPPHSISIRGAPHSSPSGGGGADNDLSCNQWAGNKEAAGSRRPRRLLLAYTQRYFYSLGLSWSNYLNTEIIFCSALFSSVQFFSSARLTLYWLQSVPLHNNRRRYAPFKLGPFSGLLPTSQTEHVAW